MKGHTYWPLSLFMICFQTWVLSLPLYGPVLFPLASYRGADPEPLVSVFLFCYAFSFVFWGALLSWGKPAAAKLKVLLSLDIVFSMALGISLLWAPVNIWTGIFALIGILGSLPSLIWLAAAARSVEDKQKGWFFGITGFFVHLIMFGMLLLLQQLHPVTCVVLIDLLLIVPLVLVYRFPEYFSLERLAGIEVTHRWKEVWLIFPLILVMYLVGGLMYQVVQPSLVQYQNMEYYARIPYIIAMPFVGLLADRMGIRPLVLFGITGIGLGYTVFAFSATWSGVLTGNTLMNTGFAFLDLFVLYGLARLITRKKPMLFLGLGIGMNIFSVLIGTWLTGIIIPYSQGNYLTVYLTAIIILFLSFLLMEWIEKKDKRPEAHYESIDEELKLAREVQRSMLPSLEQLPRGLEIAATMEMAKEVGGDFYDVIMIDENRTLFVIGDVMGKGLPAAMIMSSVVGLIRSEVHYRRSLTETLQQVNRIMLRDANFSMYVTMGLALVDTQRQTLTYANAGHLFPYLIRDGIIKQIEISSLPVGIDMDVEYEEVTIPYEAGDMLLFYTDGLVEAKNDSDEIYGFERLERLLFHRGEKSSIDHLKQIMIADVEAFAGKIAHEDDCTFLLVRM